MGCGNKREITLFDNIGHIQLGGSVKFIFLF